MRTVNKRSVIDIDNTAGISQHNPIQLGKIPKSDWLITQKFFDYVVKLPTVLYISRR